MSFSVLACFCSASFHTVRAVWTDKRQAIWGFIQQLCPAPLKENEEKKDMKRKLVFWISVTHSNTCKTILFFFKVLFTTVFQSNCRPHFDHQKTFCQSSPLHTCTTLYFAYTL